MILNLITLDHNLPASPVFQPEYTCANARLQHST